LLREQEQPVCTEAVGGSGQVLAVRKPSAGRPFYHTPDALGSFGTTVTIAFYEHALGILFAASRSVRIELEAVPSDPHLVAVLEVLQHTL
jgi:hypothetical protein